MQFVNQTTCDQDVLATMQLTLTLVKTLTNFTVTKFEELITLVVPMVISHDKFTIEAPIVYGKNVKVET